MSVTVENIFKVFGELEGVAAKETLPRFRTGTVADNKAGDNNYDPVTEADRAAEREIRALIDERFPEHGQIGEEYPAKHTDSPYSWVIDPIDGTRSYISGMPTWGTLIGLTEAGVPRYGMMSQPYVGETFLGGDGVAVHRRGGDEHHLHVRRCEKLQDACLFTTTPEMFALGRELEAFESLAKETRLVRFGADCYAYCLLAAGHVDLVVEAGLGFHDIAPLAPIIESAGGVVSDWRGKPIRAGGQALAAGDAEVHRAALEFLKPGAS